jgi:predicted GNAT family acetyltransferase
VWIDFFDENQAMSTSYMINRIHRFPTRTGRYSPRKNSSWACAAVRKSVRPKVRFSITFAAENPGVRSRDGGARKVFNECLRKARRRRRILNVVPSCVVARTRATTLKRQDTSQGSPTGATVAQEEERSNAGPVTDGPDAVLRNVFDKTSVQGF